jgi:hypothetical protein
MKKADPILLSSEILLFLYLVACSGPASKEKIMNVSIAPDDYPTLSLQDFTLQEMVPLETTEDNLLSMDLRIKFSDSLIIVMDENTTDRIHLFDRKGSYLRAITEVGEGPETIPSLEDFEPGQSGEILVLSTVGDKATVYAASTNGKLTRVFELPYIAHSFAALENGNFLFHGGYNLPFVSHRVIQTDANGKVLHRFLENDYENQMLPMIERNFFPSEKGVFVLEIFNPNLYLHQADSLAQVLHADFGTYDLPSDFWDMDLMDSFGKINENGFATLRAAFRQGNLMVTDIVVQKGRSVSKYLLFQKGKATYKLKADKDEEMLFFYPIGINKKEQVLFLTYRSILEKHARKYPDKISMEDLPEGNFDYPVILPARLIDPK